MVRVATATENAGDPFANDKIWRLGGQDFTTEIKSLFSNDKTPENLPWGTDSAGIKVALTPADTKQLDSHAVGVFVPMEVYIENTGNFWVLVGQYGLFNGVDFFYKDSNGKMVEIGDGEKPINGVYIGSASWQPLPTNKTLRYSLLVPPEILKSAKGVLIARFEVARSKTPGWDVVYSNEVDLARFSPAITLPIAQSDER